MRSCSWTYRITPWLTTTTSQFFHAQDTPKKLPKNQISHCCTQQPPQRCNRSTLKLSTRPNPICRLIKPISAKDRHPPSNHKVSEPTLNPPNPLNQLTSTPFLLWNVFKILFRIEIKLNSVIPSNIDWAAWLCNVPKSAGLESSAPLTEWCSSGIVCRTTE